MMILIVFAFFAGVVTILSPCILPILPIVLSSTIGGQEIGKSQPIGVVTGFVLSFTFFTLFLSTIVRLSGISADTLRLVSVIVIASLGASLVIPHVQLLIEQLFSKLARLVPQINTTKTSFWSGLVVGVSLGLLWTPCVGPILASVISLAITGTVTFDAFSITLAYSLGTAIPMFAIMIGGQNLLKKVPWLTANTAKIQKVFGLVMILTAWAVFFNYDRRFQTYIVKTFPGYGVRLNTFQDILAIQNELKKLESKPPTSFFTPEYGQAPEIISGGEWFNSEPLKLSALRGRVVLIDFWTYSCINCQRTFPYLRSWYEKYKDKGLVIIGVHSPEFEFEKNPDNVARAIKDFSLAYPVVQDNNFATWRAYSNHYWPAKYFIDKNGRIRYTHFGEGAYDESERVIQELLKETGANVSSTVNNSIYQVEARTPETYLGYSRMERFVSPETIVQDQSSSYTAPAQLENSEVAFAGNWRITKEYAAPQKGAMLYLSFESKEVYLVMRTVGAPATVKVFVDDTLQYFGKDNQHGVVIVQGDRLYTLITLPTSGKHIIRLEFEDDNAQLFAFTFG